MSPQKFDPTRNTPSFVATFQPKYKISLLSALCWLSSLIPTVGLGHKLFSCNYSLKFVISLMSRFMGTVDSDIRLLREVRLNCPWIRLWFAENTHLYFIYEASAIFHDISKKVFLMHVFMYKNCKQMDCICLFHFESLGSKNTHKISQVLQT